MFNRTIIASLFAIWCIFTMSGCEIATQIANSNQKPPVNTYMSKQSPSQVFTATSQAMGAFGKVTSSDRDSGVVQGQKGNWIMNASVTPASKGSHLKISARYVPSSTQMDFHSRDGLTQELLTLIESNLNEKLSTEIQQQL